MLPGADTAGTSLLRTLLTPAFGNERADFVLSALELEPVDFTPGSLVSRTEVAMALNAMLFADLLERVPTAAAYVDSVVARGERVRFDHGALRTIDGPTGSLPCGISAFTRILEPLGYRMGGLYPLPKLKMTGRAFVHCDLPFAVPQFFVSELHVARLEPEAQAAAAAIFADSRDPLGEAEHALLRTLQRDSRAPLALVQSGLPGLAAAFARHHPLPRLEDYETLLATTAEGAWIATEGNAFNHATDRVPDVTALAERLRAEGWPIKPDVEVSANGRVIQTAFIADRVRRQFRTSDGNLVEREVPGSFYEFITRHPEPETGLLDLSFDSANATGIFAVTRAG